MSAKLKKKILYYLNSLNRIQKKIILINLDLILQFFSLILSLIICEEKLDINYTNINFILVNIFICIPIYIFNNQYNIISRFLGSKSAYKILYNNLLVIFFYYIICMYYLLVIIWITYFDIKYNLWIQDYQNKLFVLYEHNFHAI